LTHEYSSFAFAIRKLKDQLDVGSKNARIGEKNYSPLFWQELRFFKFVPSVQTLGEKVSQEWAQADSRS
jgi:hypothetical protein